MRIGISFKIHWAIKVKSDLRVGRDIRVLGEVARNKQLEVDWEGHRPLVGITPIMGVELI